MTLQEAIKTNMKLVKELDIPQRVKERDALKLGIEALKRVAVRRGKLNWKFASLLPGETLNSEEVK